MQLSDLPSRLDPRRRLADRSTRTYFAIGGLSLAKALALRNDRDRFRRELRDAVLFVGLGLVVRELQRRLLPPSVDGDRQTDAADDDRAAESSDALPDEPTVEGDESSMDDETTITSERGRLNRFVDRIPTRS